MSPDTDCRIAFRATEAEVAAIARLAEALDEPSYGPASRAVAVAAGQHLAALDKAATHYERCSLAGRATAADRLGAAVRAFLAACHNRRDGN